MLQGLDNIPPSSNTASTSQISPAPPSTNTQPKNAKASPYSGPHLGFNTRGELDKWVEKEKQRNDQEIQKQTQNENLMTRLGRYGGIIRGVEESFRQLQIPQIPTTRRNELILPSAQEKTRQEALSEANKLAAKRAQGITANPNPIVEQRIQLATQRNEAQRQNTPVPTVRRDNNNSQSIPLPSISVNINPYQQPRNPPITIQQVRPVSGDSARTRAATIPQQPRNTNTPSSKPSKNKKK